MAEVICRNGEFQDMTRLDEKASVKLAILEQDEESMDVKMRNDLDGETNTKAVVHEVDGALPAPSGFIQADTLGTALHVLGVEADALANLRRVYEVEEGARKGLADAIEAIARIRNDGGRIIVTGVGKSGLIAQKAVATLNSLSIPSSFLHPVEALHGDIGMIGARDAVLMLSFSGRTPELGAMIPHLPAHLPRFLVCGQTGLDACTMIPKTEMERWIYLPAPIPIPETVSFGMASPTTSTTVAIALLDSMALAVSRVIHQDPGAVFRRNHPGGAIGGIKAGGQAL